MKKEKQYIPIKQDIEVASIVRTLLGEIEHQCLPLFELWDDPQKTEYKGTFNPIRIITPILEVAAEIEYPNEPRLLIEKLNVPESKISWFMFRHGLSHSIRPFNIKYNGETYGWGIKQFLGVHHISAEKIIMISPRKLLDDLKIYLEGFLYEQRKISIQTGVEFLNHNNL